MKTGMFLPRHVEGSIEWQSQNATREASNLPGSSRVLHLIPLGSLPVMQAPVALQIIRSSPLIAVDPVLPSTTSATPTVRRADVQPTNYRSRSSLSTPVNRHAANAARFCASTLSDNSQADPRLQLWALQIAEQLRQPPEPREYRHSTCRTLRLQPAT